MSDEQFNLAFERVIGHEGGLSRRPSDRGNWTSGKQGVGTLKGTKYGVSAMAYPHLDIANLTLDDARAIYKRDYWKPAGCDLLPAGISYAQFDVAVNQGVGDAIRFLQHAVGAKADGIIGPNTRRKIAAADPARTLREINARRIFDYMLLDHLDDEYGFGWARRAVDVLTAALRDMGADSPDRTDANPGGLLAAYMAHPDIPEGSPRHRIAGALMDIT